MEREEAMRRARIFGGGAILTGRIADALQQADRDAQARTARECAEIASNYGGNAASGMEVLSSTGKAIAVEIREKFGLEGK